MLKRILIVLALCAAPIQAAEPETIVVTVRNGLNGKPLAGIAVTIDEYQRHDPREGQRIAARPGDPPLDPPFPADPKHYTQKTDAAGQVRFALPPARTSYLLAPIRIPGYFAYPFDVESEWRQKYHLVSEARTNGVRRFECGLLPSTCEKIKSKDQAIAVARRAPQLKEWFRLHPLAVPAQVAHHQPDWVVDFCDRPQGFHMQMVAVDGIDGELKYQGKWEMPRPFPNLLVEPGSATGTLKVSWTNPQPQAIFFTCVSLNPRGPGDNDINLLQGDGYTLADLRTVTRGKSCELRGLLPGTTYRLWFYSLDRSGRRTRDSYPVGPILIQSSGKAPANKAALLSKYKSP